jgi:hypothetical protein
MFFSTLQRTLITSTQSFLESRSATSPILFPLQQNMNKFKREKDEAFADKAK